MGALMASVAVLLIAIIGYLYFKAQDRKSL
jgi:hypothetical protein